MNDQEDITYNDKLLIENKHKSCIKKIVNSELIPSGGFI